jgi:CHASE1-domain containing sensor protein
MKKSIERLDIVSGITAKDWYGRLPWMALVITLSISLVAWQIAVVDNERRISDRFDYLATQQAALVESRLED